MSSDSDGERVVARVEFTPDTEAKDLVNLIDSMWQESYAVQYVNDPDQGEPDAFILDTNNE